ncbi:MAG: pyridoxamine 5-phosphate oxidase [Actinomycetota bacterium]|jgi:pyridoxamine 5'-phosphate oxidase|nr:pyridoxamine 5-phosphate oxidase [Actinomycetota bacterium]
MNDALRREYHGEGLTESELAATPWDQARGWVDDAVYRSVQRDDVPEPLAMSLATVDPVGRPDVRTVLLRFFDPAGPGFVGSLESAKGVQIASNPAVAAALVWPAMYRAIRFRGKARQLGRDEVERYFGERPWGSRISAWASRQSQVIEGRSGLQEAFDRYAARWPDRGGATDVPVPDYWGGFRITCDEVEFWAGRPNRLHDRLIFVRILSGGLDDAAAWRVERRQP